MQKDWWSGYLFHTDSLILLERLPNEVVKMAYLDPPWYPEIPTSADIPAFMQYLARIMQQVHRILMETGSLYFHSTPSLAGVIRTTLDYVFGGENFFGEVVISGLWQHRALIQGRSQHETLYIYGKATTLTYYPPMRPYTSEEILEEWPLEELDGRRYRLRSLLIADNSRPNLRFAWRGYLPPSSRAWRYTLEGLEHLDAKGGISFEGRGQFPSQKVYMADEPKKPVESIWSDLNCRRTQSKAHGLHFPTAKPLPLMERIVEMSTDPGDLVLDPFCGSGTTLFAAASLKRRWIGSDNQQEAISITRERLSDFSPSTSSALGVVTEEDLLRNYVVVADAYRVVPTGFETFESANEPFRLNHKVTSEESLHYEFKEVNSANPVNAIKNVADEYVVAFLNSSGGRILWGVRDDRTIVGVTLDSPRRDQLRKDVTSKLFEIRPSVDPTQYRMTIHDVFDGYRKVPDLCVVEIAVPKVDNDVPYATGGDEVFVKTDAGKRKLKVAEIVAWARHRVPVQIANLGCAMDEPLADAAGD